MPETAATRGYSQGCFACLQRKVKCDERKPGCARCGRRGVQCPGYRDQSQLVFRSMNSTLAAKAGHMIPLTSPDAHFKSGMELLRRATPSPTTLQPSSDWEQHAVIHFFHHYVLVPSQGRRGYLEFLPGLFAQNPNDAALKHALLAASMAHFANMSGHEDLDTRAQKHYGLALKSAAQNLSNPESAKSNCSLASIILLQKFEIISGQRTRSGDPHDEALMHLQQQRNVSELMMPIGQSLSFLIQSRIYMSELDGLRPHSTPVEHDATIRIHLAPGNELWQLFSRSSHVCRRMRQLVANQSQTDGPPDTAVRQAFRQAFSIYEELNGWPASRPAKDQFQSIASTPARDDVPPYPPAYHTFENVQHSALWISFWCTQIHFLETIKVFIQTFGAKHAMISSSTPYLLVQLHGDQMAAVDHICGSSPYMLGDLKENNQLPNEPGPKAVGAFFLLRALYVANQSESLLGVQRTFILDRLMQIGRSKGIALALRCRERWLAAHPEFSRNSPSVSPSISSERSRSQ